MHSHLNLQNHLPKKKKKQYMIKRNRATIAFDKQNLLEQINEEMIKGFNVLRLNNTIKDLCERNEEKLENRVKSQKQMKFILASLLRQNENLLQKYAKNQQMVKKLSTCQEYNQCLEMEIETQHFKEQTRRIKRITREMKYRRRYRAKLKRKLHHEKLKQIDKQNNCLNQLRQEKISLEERLKQSKISINEELKKKNDEEKKKKKLISEIEKIKQELGLNNHTKNMSLSIEQNIPNQERFSQQMKPSELELHGQQQKKSKTVSKLQELPEQEQQNEENDDYQDSWDSSEESYECDYDEQSI